MEDFVWAQLQDVAFLIPVSIYPGKLIETKHSEFLHELTLGGRHRTGLCYRFDSEIFFGQGMTQTWLH